MRNVEKTKELREITRQGFLDAMRYLQTENIIKCTQCQCLEIPVDNNSDSCDECNTLRESAKHEVLPEVFFNDIERLEDDGRILIRFELAF